MYSIRKMVEYTLIPNFVKEKAANAFFNPNKVWKDATIETLDSISNSTRNESDCDFSEHKNNSCSIFLGFDTLNVPKNTWVWYDFEEIRRDKFKIGDCTFMIVHKYPNAKEIGELQYGIAFIQFNKSNDNVEYIYYYALAYNPNILEGKNYVILFCYDDSGYYLAPKLDGFSTLIPLADFVKIIYSQNK